MQSAFGVEHTDISKAITPGGRRKEAVRAQKAAHQEATKAKIYEAGQNAKAKAGKLVRARVSVSDVGMGTGKVLTGAGKIAMARPGLTGATVIGGGGYAAYRGVQNSNKRRTVQ